jgi:hypothetical protein
MLSQRCRDANNDVSKNYAPYQSERSKKKEAPIQGKYETPMFSVHGLPRQFLAELEVDKSASSSKAVTSKTALSSGEPGLYMRYTISRDATMETSRPSQSALSDVLDRKREFRLR